MCFLILYFLLPFLFTLFIFISFDILLLPTIFLLGSMFSIIIFSGVFFWIFLSLAVASLVYLTLHVSNLLFKNLEDKKLFKFFIILVIVIIILGFFHKKLIHTEMEIVDVETGEQIKFLENVIG